MILSIIYYIRSPIHFPYEQNQFLKNLFLDKMYQSLDYDQSFDDIVSSKQMWYWIEQTLVPGLYTYEKISEQTLIGDIEVRQMRVQTEDCKSPIKLYVNESCIPPFSKSKEEKSTFKWGDNKPNSSPYRYIYI